MFDAVIVPTLKLSDCVNCNDELMMFDGFPATFVHVTYEAESANFAESAVAAFVANDADVADTVVVAFVAYDAVPANVSVVASSTFAQATYDAVVERSAVAAFVA